MKNKIVIGSCILMLITLLALMIIRVSGKVDSIKITTIKKAYSFVSKFQEYEYINVPIFVNHKTNYYTDIKKIEETSLIDKNEENLVKLDLQKIESLNEIIKIDGEKFYLYHFKFKIIEENNFEFKDAYLKIDYINESVKINIGSFSYYKVPYYGESDEIISITNLKAIVNEVDQTKSIVGIVLGIKNKSKKSINIVDAIPLDTNFSSSISEIVELEEIPNSSEKIDELLGYKYDYINFSETIKPNISIDDEEVKYILIPLKKVGKYLSNDFGLEIDFLYENNIKKMFIDNFIYFSGINNIKYNDLEILIYENH